LWAPRPGALPQTISASRPKLPRSPCLPACLPAVCLSVDLPAEKAWEAIISAPEVARGYSQQIVETEHLFKALLEQPAGLARRVLSKAGLNPTQVGYLNWWQLWVPGTGGGWRLRKQSGNAMQPAAFTCKQDGRPLLGCVLASPLRLHLPCPPSYPSSASRVVIHNALLQLLDRTDAFIRKQPKISGNYEQILGRSLEGLVNRAEELKVKWKVSRRGWLGGVGEWAWAGDEGNACLFAATHCWHVTSSAAWLPCRLSLPATAGRRLPACLPAQLLPKLLSKYCLLLPPAASCCLLLPTAAHCCGTCPIAAPAGPVCERGGAAAGDGGRPSLRC
jgi:hypothetical protein